MLSLFLCLSFSAFFLSLFRKCDHKILCLLAKFLIDKRKSHTQDRNFFHFSFSVQWRNLMWFTYVDGNSCLRVPKKHNIFKIRFHLINSLYLDQSSNTGIIYYAALAQWFRALSSQAKDWLSVYYFPQQWQPYRKAWTATCIH